MECIFFGDIILLLLSLVEFVYLHHFIWKVLKLKIIFLF